MEGEEFAGCCLRAGLDGRNGIAVDASLIEGDVGYLSLSYKIVG